MFCKQFDMILQEIEKTGTIFVGNSDYYRIDTVLLFTKLL